MFIKTKSNWRCQLAWPPRLLPLVKSQFQSMIQHSEKYWCLTKRIWWRRRPWAVVMVKASTMPPWWLVGKVVPKQDYAIHLKKLKRQLISLLQRHKLQEIAPVLLLKKLLTTTVWQVMTTPPSQVQRLPIVLQQSKRWLMMGWLIMPCWMMRL